MSEIIPIKERMIREELSKLKVEIKTLKEIQEELDVKIKEKEDVKEKLTTHVIALEKLRYT